MEWKTLLSQKRIREIRGGACSLRSGAEVRDEFERDYGRTLYSTPVRRLRDKAQMFPLEPHDAVRTRLAHSLEVSSVARTLAAHAAHETVPQREGEIATIAATCGLIHDLGNPPFGHAGELAIQTWFKHKLKDDPAFLDRFRSLTSQRAQDLLEFECNGSRSFPPRFSR